MRIRIKLLGEQGLGKELKEEPEAFSTTLTLYVMATGSEEKGEGKNAGRKIVF